jgi:4-amino-4-deoxy-L-arabinose transferase-like glycosyltransferase
MMSLPRRFGISGDLINSFNSIVNPDIIFNIYVIGKCFKPMKNGIYSSIVLILLFVFWMTPGLIGREPWKADEPFNFGIANGMMQSGDWVVPKLTGEPFLEKPPLYFATAALCGRLFSPPLEPYEASRVATAFYISLALLFFAFTAQELYGPGYGGRAVFLLLGCVLLQEAGHKMSSDVSLFAGFSIAIYGFALCRRRGTLGGFWIGTGTGIGFLSKGLLAPGTLGISAILLPVFFSTWRRKNYFYSLLVAGVAALPWLVIWPIVLFQRSPDFFMHWFVGENFGRFLGNNFGGVVGFDGNIRDSHSYYLVNLVWLAWPAVLPAAWSVWHFRQTRRDHPIYQIPVLIFVAMIAILSASATNRSLYALPLLLPISLIALPAIPNIPVRVASIVNRFSLLFFGSLALVLWFGWFAMVTGSPSVVAHKLHDFQPDYIPRINGVLLVAAIFYSSAWLLLVIKVTRLDTNVFVNWTLGIVLIWGLIMTLWLPALNAGSSYRAAFTDLKRSLPQGYKCIASRNLGESERAMLEYFTGLQTIRLESTGSSGNCDLLLEERGGDSKSLYSGLQRIWEFNHPSIRPKNIFTLYRINTTIMLDNARTPRAVGKPGYGG